MLIGVEVATGNHLVRMAVRALVIECGFYMLRKGHISRAAVIEAGIGFSKVIFFILVLTRDNNKDYKKC